jgi:hypothetical protein
MRVASQQVQQDLLFYFSLLYLAVFILVGEAWYLYTIVAEDWFKQTSHKSYQMQTPIGSFHPGRVPRLTKEQKRKKEIERQRQKEKRLQKKGLLPLKPRQQYRSWVILPCPVEYRFMMDILSGKTFLQKMKSLQRYGEFLNPKPCELFPNYVPDPKFVNETKERKKQCETYMRENQRLRWIFKRFFIGWKIKNARIINDCDFITLVSMSHPIRVYNLSSGCVYNFDSQSLLLHIHKRLLHNDGQIPDPLVPVNPFTNEPFSLSQLLGIHSAMKAQGKTSWALEAFAKSQFQIERFLNINRKPLRLHAMKSILFDYSDWEGRSTLLNFMDIHHEEHGAVFQKGLYTFFLREFPDEDKIQQWRSLCREYYEQEILAEDEDERNNAFYRVRVKTGPLCAPPHDLFVKRSFFLRSKKDGSQSSRHV